MRNGFSLEELTENTWFGKECGGKKVPADAKDMLENGRSVWQEPAE
jgi:hypothetical protein